MVKSFVLLTVVGAALPQVMGSIRCRGGDGGPPSYCGDGVVGEYESCDWGAGNSDTLPNTCRTNCRSAHCGDGVVDLGETCDNSEDPGCDSMCRIWMGCGDGVLQLQDGEGCDDGNWLDGDGCSAFCLSETCGNGMVEEAFEECDDGNLQDHDSCSSGCTREYLWWDDLRDLPQGRYLHSATWDASRLRLVIFGGQDEVGPRHDLIEWDGEAWEAPSPTPEPAARIGAAMAHHPLLGGSLLFGGLGLDGSDLGDEWLWDGATWQRLQPALQPCPRSGAALVLDEGLGRIILFGGGIGGRLGGNGRIDDATPLGDTWERAEDAWVEATGGGGPAPSPRMATAATYDASLGGLLLFGGWDGQRLDDTWVRSANGWVEVNLAGPPPALESVALFHHRLSGVSYLAGITPGNEMGLYRFAGDRWEEVEAVYGPLVPPGARRSCAGAPVGSPEELWLTGGITPAGVVPANAVRLVFRNAWSD